MNKDELEDLIDDTLCDLDVLKPFARVATTKELAKVLSTKLMKPVELPKAQANLIKQLRGQNWRDSSIFMKFWDDEKFSATDDDGLRFMRALMYGFTVTEQKFYVLEPNEWTMKDIGRAKFFKTFGGISWTSNGFKPTDDYKFTMAEIEHYQLGSFEREEVKEDE